MTEEYSRGQAFLGAQTPRADIDQVRLRQARLQAQYLSLFSTPDGQAVLEDLSALFRDKAMASSDPHRTVVQAAQADVVTHILEMMRAGRGQGGLDALTGV